MCTLVGTLVGVLVVVLLDVPPLVGGVVKPPTVVASAKPAVARARAAANRTPHATTPPRAPLGARGTLFLMTYASDIMVRIADQLLSASLRQTAVSLLAGPSLHRG